MSTLIIGGLFVVAVVSLVALFFVLQGERRTAPKTPPSTVPTNTISPDAENVTNEEDVIPTGEEIVGSAATQTAQTTPLPQPIAYPQPDMHPVNEVRGRLNGQFYELANSLHDLRQQAAEMEQRLNTLTDIIDAIEHKQETYSE